jgi:hypothetical protein
MADLGPDKKRIAQLLRMLGSSGGERRTAFTMLESAMREAKENWSDIGNAYERDGGPNFTESELQEYGQARHAEGVDAGIKIGQARASNGGGNGHGYTLPKDTIMADYCHQQLGRLKSDAERDFVNRVYPRIQRKMNLSPGELGFLMSVYVKSGGRFDR